MYRGYGSTVLREVGFIHVLSSHSVAHLCLSSTVDTIISTCSTADPVLMSVFGKVQFQVITKYVIQIILKSILKTAAQLFERCVVDFFLDRLNGY